MGQYRTKMAYTVPKFILPMYKDVYMKFDNSSVETVWKELRLIAIPKLAPDFCPTPFIHAANCFDFLDVYIEEKPSVIISPIRCVSDNCFVFIL